MKNCNPDTATHGHDQHLTKNSFGCRVHNRPWDKVYTGKTVTAKQKARARAEQYCRPECQHK